MLGRAGEAHGVRFGKLADRPFAERQGGKHPAPRRIGQRMKDGVELIINHVVEYVRAEWISQPFS